MNIIRVLIMVIMPRLFSSGLNIFAMTRVVCTQATRIVSSVATVWFACVVRMAYMCCVLQIVCFTRIVLLNSIS